MVNRLNAKRMHNRLYVCELPKKVRRGGGGGGGGTNSCSRGFVGKFAHAEPSVCSVYIGLSETDNNVCRQNAVTL